MTSNNSASRSALDDDQDATPPAGAAKLFTWLERLPKIAIFLSVLVITIGFLVTPGMAGAVLTLLLAAGAAFLVYATWPRKVAPAIRVARIVVVLALVVLGIVKMFV